MQEQSRILMILRYLYEKTDPDHRVSSRDIKKMLEQNGIEAPVSRTIDSDVDQMIAAGVLEEQGDTQRSECFKHTDVGKNIHSLPRNHHALEWKPDGSGHECQDTAMKDPFRCCIPPCDLHLMMQEPQSGWFGNDQHD